MRKLFFDKNLTDLVPKLRHDGICDPISRENETKVWQAIHAACDKDLKQFPTSLEQDQDLLKTDLTDNQRTCVLLRVEIKELLGFLQRFGDLVQKLFQMKVEEARAMVEAEEDLKANASYIDQAVSAFM
mgnify:CR=1 FL=1